MKISEPYNFRQVDHISYVGGTFLLDSKEWEDKFIACGISRDEIRMNKEDAIKVMEFAQIFEDELGAVAAPMPEGDNEVALSLVVDD